MIIEVAIGVILAFLLLACFRELLHLCLFLLGIAIFFLFLIVKPVVTLFIVAAASIIGVFCLTIKEAKKQNIEDIEDIRQRIAKSPTGLTWIETNEVTDTKTILRIAAAVGFLLPLCFLGDGAAAVPLFLVFLVLFWGFIFDRFRKYKREGERSKIKTMMFCQTYTVAAQKEMRSRWANYPE